MIVYQASYKRKSDNTQTLDFKVSRWHQHDVVDVVLMSQFLWFINFIHMLRKKFCFSTFSLNIMMHDWKITPLAQKVLNLFDQPSYCINKEENKKKYCTNFPYKPYDVMDNLRLYHGHFSTCSNSCLWGEHLLPLLYSNINVKWEGILDY